jgi:hypothetical protein
MSVPRTRRQQDVIHAYEVREVVVGGSWRWRDLVAAAVTAYERKFGVGQEGESSQGASRLPAVSEVDSFDCWGPF